MTSAVAESVGTGLTAALGGAAVGFIIASAIEGAIERAKITKAGKEAVDLLDRGQIEEGKAKAWENVQEYHGGAGLLRLASAFVTGSGQAEMEAMANVDAIYARAAQLKSDKDQQDNYTSRMTGSTDYDPVSAPSAKPTVDSFQTLTAAAEKLAKVFSSINPPTVGGRDDGKPISRR